MDIQCSAIGAHTIFENVDVIEMWMVRMEPCIAGNMETWKHRNVETCIAIINPASIPTYT